MAGEHRCPRCERIMKSVPGQHYVTYGPPCDYCRRADNERRQKKLDDAAAARGSSSGGGGCGALLGLIFTFLFLGCCCGMFGGDSKAGQEKSSHEQFHSSR